MSLISICLLQEQVDNSIIWPAAGITNKIGEMTIRELRTKAEADLGNKFNIKAFHDIVLDTVGPLDILSKTVADWTQSMQRKSKPQ